MKLNGLSKNYQRFRVQILELHVLTSLSLLLSSLFLLSSPLYSAPTTAECRQLITDTAEVESIRIPFNPYSENAAQIEFMKEAPRQLDVEALHYWFTQERLYGIKVLERNNGVATKASITILAAENLDIYVSGTHNNWNTSEKDKLRPRADNPRIYDGIIEADNLDGLIYLLEVTGTVQTTMFQDNVDQAVNATIDLYKRLIFDPTAFAVVDYNNNGDVRCLFIDIDAPSRRSFHTSDVALPNKSYDRNHNASLANDKPMLALEGTPWGISKDLVDNPDLSVFQKLASPKVIQVFKEFGFNTFKSTPFAYSTGRAEENWAFTYLSTLFLAVQDIEGLREMSQAFYSSDIRVIHDTTFHIPTRHSEGNGIVQDRGMHNLGAYLGSPTDWGTMFLNFNDPDVRRYMIEAHLNRAMTTLASDFRLDAVYEIQFRPGGYEFIKELNNTLHQYGIYVLIENFDWNDAWTKSVSKGGAGANSSYNAVVWDVFKSEVIKSNPDVHNLKNLIRAINPGDTFIATGTHDKCTPSQSYTESGYCVGHFIAEALKRYGAESGQYMDEQKMRGKTIVWESLARAIGSQVITIPQSLLLQEGSFDQAPNGDVVDWRLLNKNPGIVSFMRDFNRYIETNSAFRISNISRDQEWFVSPHDSDSSIMVFYRADPITKEEHLIVINFGENEVTNFLFGVENKGEYKLELSSDFTEYEGTNRILDSEAYSEDGSLTTGVGAFGRRNSLTIPRVPPLSTSIYKRKF